MSIQQPLEVFRPDETATRLCKHREELLLQPERAGEIFDEEYFRVGCGPFPYDRTQPWWGEFFGGIAQELIRSLRPRHVLDAGCALGFLVEAFWDRGVSACGIDISPFAISHVRRDVQPFCFLQSLGEEFPTELRERGKFDLITCIEVLEHMPEAEARKAASHLAEATDTILFSSTPNDLEEATHINVKPLIYWLHLFAEHGFSPDLEYDASFVTSHSMLLRRRDIPVSEDVLKTFAAVLTFRGRVAALEYQLSESKRLGAETGQELTVLRVAHESLSQMHSTIKEADRQQIEALRHEQTTMQLRSAELQSLNAGLRARLEEVSGELAAERTRSAAESAGVTAERAERAAERAQWASERESAAQERRRLEEEIASVHAAGAEASRIAQDTVRSQLKVVAHRVEGLENQISDILNSRIWRLLMRCGSLLLRLTGQRSSH